MKNEVTVFKGGVAVDDRGSVRFVNDFNFEGVKRFYQITNHEVGFIRAWHGHQKEAKYVYVTKGTFKVGTVPFTILDGGYTHGEALPFILSAETPQVLFIPAGFANGFKNLTPDAQIMFFSTSTLEESKGDDIRFPYDSFGGSDFWKSEYR